MAKALRERVGKQYKGTQRTRKAVHGECTVELAKWTFPIISLCREPYEAKVSRTGLTGGMGSRTVRQRALCLPSDNSCGPLLSPVEPSEGSLSTGCQVSKRVVNPLCSPPFLLVAIPIPRRWMSFFLVHPLPYLGLRPRRHPVEQHFFE